MAIVKVVGVTVRGGDFDGKPWRNLYLSTETTDSDDKETCGVFCENHKIQFKKLNDVLSLGLSPDKVWDLKAKDFQNLVGKSIKLFYDKYHNVDYVMVLPSSSNS